jgi:S1-C subfamily serine protease
MKRILHKFSGLSISKGNINHFRTNVLSGSVILGLVLFSCTINVEDTVPDLVKKVQRAVVTVRTYDENGQSLGLGTGFFINRNGVLITNYHVLQGASQVNVLTADGWEHALSAILAEDKDKDLIMAKVAMSRDVPLALSLMASVPEVRNIAIELARQGFRTRSGNTFAATQINRILAA